MLQNIKTQVLVLSCLGLVACGGGDSDKDRYYYSDSSLNATELAQVAAAIQTAKTTFDVVAYDGQATIGNVIDSGDAYKEIKCGSGTYQVTPNTKTAYAEDGRIVNNACITNGYKWGGVVELECLDRDCDKSITTATAASWQNRNRNVELTINGEILSDQLKDGFKGTAVMDRAGQKTYFDFADIGLVQEYFNQNLIGGFGYLKVSNGRNNQCIDGSFGYNIKQKLALANNSLRLVGGEIEILSAQQKGLGTVVFERDGGVSVRTRSGATQYISASQFERYCGLGEAYRFSEG